MKLTEFNAANCGTNPARAEDPVISITVGNGQFRFNKASVLFLNLSIKDQLKFFQDEESGDWYLEKVDAEGFVVKTSTNNPFYIISGYLARQFASAYEVEEASMRVQIEKEPVKFEGRKLYGIAKI